MAEHVQEPSDSTTYSVVMRVDTLRFFAESTAFYLSILERNIAAVDRSDELKAILAFRVTDPENSPVRREKARTERARSWVLDQIGSNEPDPTDIRYVDGFSHGAVRYLKSVGRLYLDHLQETRDQFAIRSDVSQVVLQDVDEALAALKEKLAAGVFRSATEIPLILADALRAHDREVKARRTQTGETASGLPPADDRERPPPVVLSSIPILDPDLKARCMDLFGQFLENQQSDRFDTVLREATTIFENRIRTLAGLPSTSIGPHLATAAFKGTPALLVVSKNDAEQEAVHQLFRGIFGFIRNPPHHTLLGPLPEERVVQILGLLDYLLSIADGATKSQPATPTGGSPPAPSPS